MRANNPIWPWVLGLAGLIPFFALIAGALLAPAPYGSVSEGAWSVYAAAILSFLGGTRWGAEVVSRPDSPSPLVLIASNVPPLLGWVAVILNYQQPAASLGLLAGGFVLQWIWDAASTGRGVRGFPLWYGPLRLVLTAGVLISAGLLAWVKFMTG